jgi:hypothetical protein
MVINKVLDCLKPCGSYFTEKGLIKASFTKREETEKAASDIQILNGP